jgi:hypothetical protein
MKATNNNLCEHMPRYNVNTGGTSDNNSAEGQLGCVEQYKQILGVILPAVKVINVKLGR